MMVAPLRLVPGIIAKHCTKPTLSASRCVIWIDILNGGQLDGLLSLPLFSPQNDEAANDEGARHDDWVEQIRLDGFAKQQAQHHGGYKSDQHIDGEALRHLELGKVATVSRIFCQ